jgi:2,3-bisphosphoglycerate-dependent phosphoglycerate mutase
MLETIYLIRHAAPDRSTGVPYNIPPGPPLTDIGRREAAETARWLAGRGIEHLLASPFERARATAEAIGAELPLPITFVEALREGGPGEQHTQIRARVAELLAQLDDGAPRSVALVTHGICIRTLLQITTNDKINLTGHVYDNGNCSPTAGVWQGVRGDQCWRWELAFRPA